MGADAVRLLDAEPDLVRYLTGEEEGRARQIVLPVVRLQPGEINLSELLSERSAFSALVLDGMVLYGMRIGEQRSVRVMGPGDLVPDGAGPRSRVLSGVTYRAIAETRLALLGEGLLIAAHRWPRLVAGLHARLADQRDRVTAQLVICQMPRVADRVLAMLWLLADVWGRVTPSGVTLPLAITHELLGEMVGARRPTVTLALSELSERGAIIRQDRGWLLLEPQADLSTVPEPKPHEPLPTIHPEAQSLWSAGRPDGPVNSTTQRELRETVARLRDQHVVQREAVSLNLARARRLRQQMMERRVVVTRANSRPPAPSS